MATIKFILQSPYKPKTKIVSTKETRIYAFMIFGLGRVIKIKTEYVVKPTEWDFSKQGKKEKLNGAIEFNGKLQELKEDLFNEYKNIIKEKPDITLEELSELMKEYGKSKEPFLKDSKSFFEVFEEFLSYLPGEVTPGTIRKFVTLKKSLKKFSEENKNYHLISFGKIDMRFYDGYTKYLRNQEPRGRQKTRPEGEQKGLLVDTIGKYIESLKTFLKWAEGRGYNKNTTYKNFQNFTASTTKLRKKKNDIVTLTLKELKQFYNHDFSDRPALDRVRDLFCFATFTGQRWSDIERFDKKDIEGDIWSFEAYKTKQPTKIDLVGFAAPALDILKKYNYELPKISLQKFNEMLKNAGALAKINDSSEMKRYVGTKEIMITKPKYEFMSSHMARRTCVSLLLNVYGIPATHVLEITGHSELKTLQKYIDKTGKSRRDAMSRTEPVTKEPLKIVKAS